MFLRSTKTCLPDGVHICDVISHTVLQEVFGAHGAVARAVGQPPVDEPPPIRVHNPVPIILLETLLIQSLYVVELTALIC